MKEKNKEKQRDHVMVSLSLGICRVKFDMNKATKHRKIFKERGHSRSPTTTENVEMNGMLAFDVTWMALML